MANRTANRMKEDEKIEKQIRGLLKLPENRSCINCNCLGPQYVCTTFLTFVCTNCSGVHREFTHRVKSVSMAKFNAEEVSALQAGGNERARQIYFKEWDPQRNCFPDGSNLHRLRDFIKHVYVDRKYSGDKSTDKLPRLRLSDRRESYENKKVGADTFQQYHSERISPGGRNENKGFRYVYDERRSPRYAQENSRYGGYRRNLARFEVVDDRFRDDGVESGRRTHTRRFSGGEFKLGSRSPHCEKNMDRSMSPVVHPVRDILGENVPPLQVGNLPQANDGKDAGGSAHNQRIVSSSSTGSIDGDAVGLQIVNSGSLIDLSTDLEPSNAAVVPQTQQMPPSIDGGNGASFIFSAQEKSPHAPNANTLESLLFELSAPPVEPARNTAEVPSSGDAPSTAPSTNLLTLPSGDVSPAAPLGPMSALPNSDGAASTKSTTNVLALPPNGGALAAAPLELAPELPNSSGDSTGEVTDGQQLPSMQQYQPSAFPAADGSFSAQQITPSIASCAYPQPCSSSSASNAQIPSSASAEQLSQAVSKPAQDASSGAGSQPFPVEAKSGGRKELPADLFTASYSSAPAPVPGWQTGPSHGVGFGMQYYPTAVQVPAFPTSARSTNPFDLNNETIQAPMFPSMASLQDALPNGSAPTGLLRASSVDTQYPQLISQSYSSAMSQSSYAGQQVHNNMPPSRIQDFGSLGTGGTDFSSLNTNQQLASIYSAPTTPNSFSSIGGNPFG